MGRYCFIVGCKSNASKEKISFYSFPKPISISNPIYKHKQDELEKKNKLLLQRQKVWIQVIKRGSLREEQLRHAVVCEKHFINAVPAKLEDINHPDWAPCQNLGYAVGSALKRKADVNLYDRACKRAKNNSLVDKSSLKLLDASDSCMLNNDCEKSNNEVLDNEVLGFADNNHHNCDIHNQESCTNNQSIQTELTMNELCEIFEKLKLSLATVEKLESKLNDLLFTHESFQGNDAQTKYFTGLSSSQLLFEIHNIISPHLSNSQHTSLSTFHQLIITLMKLRLNFPFEYFSYRFGVSCSTIIRYFRSTIHVLFCTFKNLVLWPERDCLYATMPRCFRERYKKKVTTVIDCFEVFIESPSNKCASAETWSSYKHHKTAKNLIAMAPQGSINFISESWGGRASDKHITENCGFLQKIKSGDCVMADRGFTISHALQILHAELLIPHFTKGKSQLSATELETTRNIANVRIHIERVIGSLRQKFTILSSLIPISMLLVDEDGISTYDEILTVCCAFFNLCPSVVPMD